MANSCFELFKGIKKIKIKQVVAMLFFIFFVQGCGRKNLFGSDLSPVPQDIWRIWGYRHDMHSCWPWTSAMKQAASMDSVWNL